MNPLNYASLEASKRLVEAGIVLETDVSWMHYPKNDDGTDWYWSLQVVTRACPIDKDRIVPAPSMAEVWRELPDGSHIAKKDGHTYCYAYEREYLLTDTERYINPTDALIDLLIWVRKEAV